MIAFLLIESENRIAIATTGHHALIEAGLAEVERRSGSARPSAEYARYLKRFRYEIKPDLLLASTADVHVFAYAPGPSGKTPLVSTVTVRLAALQSFFSFAWRAGAIPANPVERVKRPKGSQPQPKGLGAEDLKTLLAAIPCTPGGLRDRAVIQRMVFAGLRRTEALNLRACDLDVGAGHVHSTARTKGGAMRRCELPAAAVDAKRAYWSARGTDMVALDPQTRLFPFSESGFYGNLPRYGIKSGLPGLTPHALQYSAAKLWRQAGRSRMCIRCESADDRDLPAAARART